MKDLTGLQFNRWTFVKFDKRVGRRYYWICICECGTLKSTSSVYVTSGESKSCGCLKAEIQRRRLTTHAKCGTKIYRTWSNMIQRCTNKNAKYFKIYGGRGIKVCQRWLNSFESFYKDIGNPPSPKHSIDRINNDGDYEPSNCRWATPREQNLNRRNTKNV